jgi:hypothetical protein
MFRNMALLIAGVALMAGCSHVSGGVATSNVPIAPGSYRELGHVRGESCVYHLLGFIPLTAGNETRHALAEALRQKPDSTALVSVTADTYQQYFLLFSRTCTQVYGMAVAPR